MEYKSFPHDFISRCLDNYKNLCTQTEFNVTLAVTTLLTICAVIKSDNNAHNDGSGIMCNLKKSLDDLFQQYYSLKTSTETYININNIRNGFIHMIENDIKFISNDEKQIKNVKFKSQSMTTEQEASVSDIHNFLLDLYEIVKEA